MTAVKGRILLFSFLLVIWLLLTLPFRLQELGAGVFIAAVIAALPLGAGAGFSDLRLTPRSILYAVMYLFVFLAALVRANLDVARRVVHPRLPINPGIVKVKTRLQSRLGRIVLANSITLTPGTITVETKGEDFYIHWIDMKSDHVEETTEEIVRGFEKYLEVIFG